MTKYEIVRGTGRINGYDNRGFTAPHTRIETLPCRNCCFTGGPSCQIHTSTGRGKIDSLLKSVGSMPEVIESLACSGEIPLVRTRRGSIEVDCRSGFISGTFEMSTEGVAESHAFGFGMERWHPSKQRK